MIRKIKEGYRVMDAALLLLPTVGFVNYDDERMIRTTDAVRQDLEEDGLLHRYATGNDGTRSREGVPSLRVLSGLSSVWRVRAASKRQARSLTAPCQQAMTLVSSQNSTIPGAWRCWAISRRASLISR